MSVGRKILLPSNTHWSRRRACGTPRRGSVGQEVLAHARVLGRPVPEPQRVFPAVRGDPERHDETVLSDVDPIDQQADQIERVEGGRLPGGQLRRVFATKRRLTALLLVARLRSGPGTGSKLRA